MQDALIRLKRMAELDKLHADNPAWDGTREELDKAIRAIETNTHIESDLATLSVAFAYAIWAHEYAAHINLVRSMLTPSNPEDTDS